MQSNHSIWSTRRGIFATDATLAAAAERQVDEFTSQDLANTAWAFATAGHLDGLIFTVMERAV